MKSQKVSDSPEYLIITARTVISNVTRSQLELYRSILISRENNYQFYKYFFNMKIILFEVVIT